jgi:multiple sugar transport system permease protein
MKLFRLLALAALAAVIMPQQASAKKVVLPKAYLYGFVANFTDSVVYFTDIQSVDSVWYDTKNMFLLGRSSYSNQLREYFTNTMKILVPCVIGTVLTSSMAGYALGRLQFPGKKLWFALTIGAMILPGHVVLIPLYLTYSAIGATNTYTPFYLAAWCGGGASNVFLMRQFMRTLPRDYDESAMIDGANRLQIFLKILVPLCAPIMITVAIFSFMFYWNDFQGPLIYLRSDNKFTLALGILSLRGAYAS